MKYYNKEEFMRKIEVSRSTVDRFYRDYPICADERVKDGKRVNIPETHLKYFVKELWMEEDKAKDDRIKKLEKLVSLIKEDSLAANLWKKDWVWYGTVSYRNDLSRDNCYNKMQLMFKKLIDVFGSDSDLKLFFTTESFNLRDGHHSHFVIDCHPDYKLAVKQMTKEIFTKDRIDIRLYNYLEAGIFYITKEGLQGTDWDYLF